MTGVTMAPKNSSVVVGNARSLAATVAPVAATNKSVTFSSSDPLIATVSPSGVASALSIGTTVITVTTADGSFTDTCNLTVTSPDP